MELPKQLLRGVLWKRCSEKFCKIHRKKSVPESLFLIRLQVLNLHLYLKKIQAQLFSSKFCEISKNTFSYRTPPVASSWTLSKISINIVFQYKYHIFWEEYHLVQRCGKCHPYVHFSGTRLSLFFWQRGNILFVTFINIYRKYHISMNFLIKIIFHFCLKKKTSYIWGKRNTIFPDITKKIIFNIWRKHHISKNLFEKDHLSFCV